jgi:DUF1680 family protein
VAFLTTAHTASSITTVVADGILVSLTQRTTYPWDGEIALQVAPAEPAEFILFLHVPAWAAGASLTVNGEAVSTPVEAGAYAQVRRRWASGDVVCLTLPMPVRLLSSHPHVTNNLDRVALVRGPLVYCIEAADHPDLDVWDIVLPAAATWNVTWEPDLLGGVMVARTAAFAPVAPPVGGPLYRPHDPRPPRYNAVSLAAIPYYAWAKREPGHMQVWIPVAMTS